MQPASGFKETGASLKQGESFDRGISSGSSSSGRSGSAGNAGSISMPVHEHYGLGYLGASLGNQAFHSATTSSLQQQRQASWSPEAAARAASGGSQRFQRVFQDRLESMQQQQQQRSVHGSGSSSPVTAFPSSVIGSLAVGQQVPHPFDLDASQEKIFQEHPDLFKQFQEQAAQIPRAQSTDSAINPGGVDGSHGSSTESAGGESVGAQGSVERDAEAVMRALGL